MRAAMGVGLAIFAGLVLARPIQGLAQTGVYKPPAPYGAAQTKSYQSQANKMETAGQRAARASQEAAAKANADMAKAQREREAAAAKAKADKERAATAQAAAVAKPTTPLKAPAYPALQPITPIKPQPPFRISGP